MIVSGKETPMSYFKNLVLIVGLIGLLAKYGDRLFGNPDDVQVPTT